KGLARPFPGIHLAAGEFPEAALVKVVGPAGQENPLPPGLVDDGGDHVDGGHWCGLPSDARRLTLKRPGWAEPGVTVGVPASEPLEAPGRNAETEAAELSHPASDQTMLKADAPD